MLTSPAAGAGPALAAALVAAATADLTALRARLPAVAPDDWRGPAADAYLEALALLRRELALAATSLDEVAARLPGAG